MNAIEMLTQQLDTANLRLHHSAGDLTVAELTARPIPGVNPIGFIAWHIARSQDWAFNTAVRGVAEVMHRPRWQATSLAVPGMGTGFSAAEAEAVAARCDVQTLLAYADAVHTDVRSWLAAQSESIFDDVPDVTAHDAPYAEYQTAGFRAEMDSGPEHDDAVGRKGGQPVWIYLTSVAVTHAHRHLGEIDLVKDLLRSKVS